LSVVPATTLERFLRRDRMVIAMVLIALTIVCWLQMWPAHGEGSHQLMPCCGATFSIAFWMWVVMTGMTIPPVFQAHAWIVRRRIDHGAPYIPSLFPMTMWSLFSFVVARAPARAVLRQLSTVLEEVTTVHAV